MESEHLMWWRSKRSSRLKEKNQNSSGNKFLWSLQTPLKGQTSWRIIWINLLNKTIGYFEIKKEEAINRNIRHIWFKNLKENFKNLKTFNKSPFFPPGSYISVTISSGLQIQSCLTATSLRPEVFYFESKERKLAAPLTELETSAWGGGSQPATEKNKL